MTDAAFEHIVDQHYMNLYRFAYSLSRCEDAASDLVQETLLTFADKGHQLRDPSKVKSWLFTTLHRHFLRVRRRETTRPTVSLDQMETEPAKCSPDMVARMDAQTVVAALNDLDETFRVPLTLFHLEEWSYKEIAATLNIPIGTVMSRLARGREHLYRRLADRYTEAPGKVIAMPAGASPTRHKHG